MGDLVGAVCEVMSRAGNGLRTLRLGGNGAWGKGVSGPLVEALSSAACVLEELDVGGSRMDRAAAVSVIAACDALKTLTLAGLSDQDFLTIANATSSLHVIVRGLSYSACQQPRPNITFGAPTWSLNDKHEWVALSGDLLEASYALGPNSNQSQKNGLCRANVGFVTGLNYWEISFPDASNDGHGSPSIGVVCGDCPLGGDELFIIGGKHGEG